MFPWVCLATMPLFYPFDWPKLIISYAEKQAANVRGGICNYIHKYILINKYIHCTSRAVQTQGAYNDTNELPDYDDDDEKTDESFLSSEDYETEIKDDDPKSDLEQKPELSEHEERETSGREENWNDGKKNLALALIALHVVTQAFLPYSHFITKVKLSTVCLLVCPISHSRGATH